MSVSDPLYHCSKAAQEATLELIRAGKINDITEVSKCFTHLLNHYRDELKRIERENKGQ